MTPRRLSWWERDAELATPSTPALPKRVDVLIVGAGFMGRWLAYFLARLPTPPRVLVVERDTFTYGASSRNAGFLTCGQVSEMLADAETDGLDAVVANFLMRRRGMALLRREFPDLPVDGCGSLDWDPLDDARRALGRELNAAAGADVYDVREARIDGHTRPTMFNRADAGLDPVQLLHRLASAAEVRAGGVQYAWGVEARAVGGGLAQLRTADGTESVRYGNAFLCTNAFTSRLHPVSEVKPGRGQVVVTSPVRSEAPRALGYLNAGYDYFRWVGDRLLIGGGRHAHPEENGPTDLVPTDDVGAYLRRAAERVIGHTAFEVEHHWAGLMGFRRGRHIGGPSRDTIDASTDALAGFGGMGVALTPAVANEVVRAFAGAATPGY